MSNVLSKINTPLIKSSIINRMKFIAASLIALGLLSQEAETKALGFDQYLQDSFKMPQPSQPKTSIQFSISNEGFQTFNNAFSQNTQNKLLWDIDFPDKPSFPSPSLPSTKFDDWSSSTSTNSPWDEYKKLYPRNPLAHLDSSKWNIFDNSERFCFGPRYWTGTECVCKNQGVHFSGSCYIEPPMHLSSELLALKYINRQFDGTQNNQNYPLWGSKSTDLLRLCPAEYQDGKSQIWQQKPNPRDVSNCVGEIEGRTIESRLGWNMLLPIWGQFIDHDITLSPENGVEHIPIKIPMCDKYMDPQCSGLESFNFGRSVYNPNHQVRTNINVITAWIDASNVYGSDKETADSLREFQNGKLKTSEGNLLPKDEHGNFLAGDERANENVALTTFHTIFMREHNRICDIVLKKDSSLTDEQVFQIARNYVAGLIQHITYDEFLPALFGQSNYDKYVGEFSYDPTVNPGILSEFSTAAFRLGHPLINSPFKLMDDYGNLLEELDLGEMFFNPSKLKVETVNEIFNGLSRTLMKERSLELVNELRNFLFLTPAHTVKIDLFSFNLQRGRDHGIGSIGAARSELGMARKTDFKDIFADREKAKSLEKLYQSIDNVDLWLGIIGEKPEVGAILGELGIRLNALQFKNIRNGDKFWYENTYPEEIIKEIKATKFSDIIKRNTDVKNIPKNAFRK